MPPSIARLASLATQQVGENAARCVGGCMPRHLARGRLLELAVHVLLGQAQPTRERANHSVGDGRIGLQKLAEAAPD